MHEYFVTGPIPPGLIARVIADQGQHKDVGAMDIFIGQVRADEVRGQVVEAIDYSGYFEMAERQLTKIKEAVRREYGLTGLYIYHSTGTVRAGEMCLFVLATAGHRRTAFEGCRRAVEWIKREVPIFGKEIFAHSHEGQATYQWKENTF